MKDRGRSESGPLRWAGLTVISAARRISSYNWRKKALRINNGTESTSLRISAGLQQDLALALVRQAGLFQAAAGRPGVKDDADRPAEIRRGKLDRSGPAGQ